MGAGRPSRRTGHRRPPKGRRDRCPTGKPRHRTMSDAAATARHRMEENAGDLFTYECPSCKGWHLTSMSGDAYRTAREGGWATGSDR